MVKLSGMSKSARNAAGRRRAARAAQKNKNGPGMYFHPLAKALLERIPSGVISLHEKRASLPSIKGECFSDWGLDGKGGIEYSVPGKQEPRWALLCAHRGGNHELFGPEKAFGLLLNRFQLRKQGREAFNLLWRQHVKLRNQGSF